MEQDVPSDSLPVLSTLLPDADAQFVVMTDTHLLDTSAPHAREFASRRRQNDRVATALRIVAGLSSTPVLHLGDLVQDYPHSTSHPPLLAEAVQQIRAVAADAVFAPGNTDIGDKPDPSSPAAWVSSETLGRFVRATDEGAWTSRDLPGVHVLTLAASLLNSGLPEEEQQWQWLAQQLDDDTGDHLVLCLHYPIFWRTPQDPGVGNYDVIGEPARSRLIDMVASHDVSAVFTGHSHFAFLNRIGTAKCFGVPSTSFTRPGFSEMFSSPPPPDRGRDDVPKLGMLLVRAHDDGLRAHALRTGLLEERQATAPGARPVLTGTPRDLPTSRLGVVLRHPLATYAQVPETFPSVRPQPVRNDYPFLAMTELGATEASVAADDLAVPCQVERLDMLRDEGVRVTERLLCPSTGPVDVPECRVDTTEWMLLDHVLPGSDVVSRLATRGSASRISALVREQHGGAELPRWRYGLTLDEARDVDRLLADQAVERRDGPRLLVTATSLIDSSWTLPHNWQVIAGVDVVYSLASDTCLADLVEAFLQATMTGCGFLVDALVELDRTLDLNPGLLDRMGNPRPPFHGLAVLNTVLHGHGEPRITREADRFTVDSGGRRHVVDLRRLDDAVPLGNDEVIRLADGFACPAREGIGPWVEVDAP